MGGRTIRALVVAADGRRPEPKYVGRVERLSCLLSDDLHPEHRAEVEAHSVIEGGELLARIKAWADGPPDQRLWLCVAGRVEFDDFDERVLRTTEQLGLELTKLAKMFARAPVAERCVVFDFDGVHADAIAELDWGTPRTLLAVGDGVGDRLAEVLCAGEPGPVSAGDVASALGAAARTRQPDSALNVTVAGRAQSAQRTDEERQYLDVLRDEALDLPLGNRLRASDPDARRRVTDVYTAVGTTARGDTAPDARDRHAVAGDLHEGSRESDDALVTAHQRFAEHPCLFLVGDPGSGKTTFPGEAHRRPLRRRPPGLRVGPRGARRGAAGLARTRHGAR